MVGNKMIDEMARSMCFQRDSCSVESCTKVNCEKTWLAEKLYNEGYRKQEWISVDKILPEDADERVLVYIVIERSYTELDTDRFVGGRWVRWENYVTHWMPLPQPPETKGETE